MTADDGVKPLSQQLDALTQLVEKLEQPDVPLEDALKLYEEGVQLARTAQKTLDIAEQKVTILSSNEAE
jgi:exodeoxyribonuclease VII small subunit